MSKRKFIRFTHRQINFLSRTYLWHSKLRRFHTLKIKSYMNSNKKKFWWFIKTWPNILIRIELITSIEYGKTLMYVSHKLIAERWLVRADARQLYGRNFDWFVLSFIRIKSNSAFLTTTYFAIKVYMDVFVCMFKRKKNMKDFCAHQNCFCMVNKEQQSSFVFSFSIKM